MPRSAAELWGRASIRIISIQFDSNPGTSLDYGMSKTWILIALLFQLILIIWFYHLPQHGDSNIQEEIRNYEHAVGDYKKSFTDVRLLKHLQRKDINWKEIPRKPAPPAKEIHDKWIVLTTVNSPTEDVKKLAGIEGWKVVVVGDTKTPADWRYSYILIHNNSSLFNVLYAFCD